MCDINLMPTVHLKLILTVEVIKSFILNSWSFDLNCWHKVWCKCPMFCLLGTPRVATILTVVILIHNLSHIYPSREVFSDSHPVAGVLHLLHCGSPQCPPPRLPAGPCTPRSEKGDPGVAVNCGGPTNDCGVFPGKEKWQGNIVSMKGIWYETHV